MKPLFVVTSALSPKMGVFSFQERYEQTLETIYSIRRMVPGARIMLSDVSVNVLPEKEKSEIVELVDYFVDFSQHEILKQLSEVGAKSQAETILTLMSLSIITDNGLDKDIDRIFKITGRISLSDDFDPTKYENLDGKYVFKKRVKSWMGTQYKNASHLFDTRLYSFCTTLIETHKKILSELLDDLQFIDLEHAMFSHIPEDLIVEFEKVCCQGRIASSGEWRYD